MAFCVNCGKKIKALNSCPEWDTHWKQRDRTMCLSCSDSFISLLMKNKYEWDSKNITREFIINNQEFLHLQKAGLHYLCDYADYVQGLRTPEKLEQLKQTAEDMAREQELNRELAKILISSGFNFDGYRIVKYSGYISGDDAVQIPRSGLFDRGQNGKNLTDALVRIRRQALKELKQAAYDLGCNAVIGVDFDYITLDPETATITGGTLYEPYVICVTANGNAVVIEKIED